jgi:aspartate racemase
VPERVAVVCENHQLTYRELNDSANRLAHYLRHRGVGPNVRVGLCLDRSLDFAVATLAILKSGGACVPLDPNYPQERLAYMLQDVQARVVVSAIGMLPKAGLDGIETLFLPAKPEVFSSQPRTNPDSGVTPEDVAYVIYTSGSTGKPRGVLLTHTGLVNYNTAAAKMYALGPDDRILQFCSISFDVAIEEMFATWISGATLVLRSAKMSLAVPDFIDWISRARVTVLDLPTAYWHEWVHQLPELKAPIPQSLRLVIVGGEKASSNAYATWLQFVGRRARWINSYGPTETSISATAFEPSLDPSVSMREGIPIGRPMSNTRAYILDRHLKPVPVGVGAELHIGGVGVARGYLNRPELTAEKFIADPYSSDPTARLYKTGDLARFLPSGEIEFLGRRDDQVKIRGFRVELGEIEEVLASCEGVRDVAVVSAEDQFVGKRLVAYFVPAPGRTLDGRELRRFLADRLPDYMVPSAFVPLTAMPMTPNGKVDRRGLPKLQASSLPTGEEFAAPVDELHTELVKIWEDVLGRRPVGIRDNFFEIGGHSLLAARLMHRIGRVLKRRLPLTLLLQAPTIDQLAAMLGRDQWSGHWSSLVPMQPEGSRPPFFCVHGVGGNVLGFRELARLMGPDHPFYGLQTHGLDGKQRCFARIEEMAAHYIDELKTVQPEGPYFIGGYSFGGMVAYEMAQQLRERDEQVGLLALLDTYPGNLTPVASSVLRLLVKPSRQNLLRDLPKIAKTSLQRRIKGLLLSRTLKNVLRANHAAADHYVLKSYRGKATLFRASEASLRSFQDPHSAWEKLAVGGLEIHEITGDHGGILVGAQVIQLAAKLNECIDEVYFENQQRQSRLVS